jgi:hypothetical protein
MVPPMACIHQLSFFKIKKKNGEGEVEGENDE